MKSKKLLSVIIALAMIMQMLPVFATQAVAEDTVTAISYFVNDQFNTDGDTQGWAKGSVKSGTAAFTVEQGTAPDGSGALILHAEGGDASAAGKQPNTHKTFDEKINFEGKTVVIKTRFMQAGDGAETPDGKGFLKFNQPNDIAFSTTDDMKWNWTNTWGRTDAVPAGLSGSSSGYNTLCGWFELLEFNTLSLEYMAKGNQKNWGYSTYSEGSTVGKWIEAEITINGSEDITISAKVDGVEGETVNGSLNQGFTGPQIAYTLYNDKTATEWITEFTTLDSLTWETATKNDIYIDYIQIYEPANVDIKAKETIKEDGVFTFEVINSNDTEINYIPDGAVTVEGVETEASYDAETGILTLTPVTTLTGGETYTAVVDTAKLEEAGIIYEGETTFDINVEIKLPDGFYLDDQFNTDGDTQGWAKGRVKSGTAAFTVEQGTAPDGSGALIFTSEGAVGADGGTEPNIFKELTDKIPLNEGKKIVIKTRFMQAGDDATAPTTGTSYLRFNQPNNENLLSEGNINKGTWAMYPNMTTKINNVNSVNDWFTLLKIGKSALSYRTEKGAWYESPTLATVDTLGKWIDATITINSNTSVEVSATIDNATYSVTDGSLIYSGTGPLVSYTLYNDPTATEALTQYPSLDSLTWVSHTKNTVYVDYIQVFEPQKPKTYEAQAVMPQGSTIEVGSDFEVKFVNVVNENAEAATLTEIPEGAVTVENVATTNTFDALTQTLTLTPDSLTEGNIYKVVIDSEKLAEANIIYKGTTEFSVTARGARSTGFVLSDNFADGFDNWEVGLSQDGFEASMEVVQDSGAKDGKALKITFPAKDETVKLPSNYGTVTKAVGNGIEFKEGKTITFETRLKRTAATTDYFIKVNRPNTLEQVGTDYTKQYDGKNEGTNTYLLFGYAGNYPGMLIPAKRQYEDYVPVDNNLRYGTGDGYKSGFTATDVWVTYKVVFTPSDGKYYITMTYTDENGAEQTVKSNIGVVMKDVKAAIDKEFGYNYYNASTEYDAAYHANNFYKAIERLTFTSDNGGDLYIDYVKVYEESSVSATVPNGGSVEVGSPFELKLTDSNDEAAKVAAVPTDAFTVEGVETTNSYDAETQVLTLAPKTALAIGTTYKINVDTAKLAAVGMTYKGATQFRVVANNTSATGTRMIVNDQFNTEGDAEGWVSGAVEANKYKAAVVQEPGKAADGSGVLKITSAEVGTGAAGQQPNAYKEFAGKVAFDKDKKLVIKTKFMQTGDESNNGTGYLKFNQPNNSMLLRTDSWGIPYYWTNTLGRTDTMPSIDTSNALGRWFQLLKFDSSNLAYMAAGDQKAWKDTAYAEGSTVDKWIEATITINGSENITISANIDGAQGGTVEGTIHQDFKGAYAGYTLYNDKNATAWIDKFTSLDSLTWLTTTAANEIYVDYIQVYEVELNSAKAQLLNGKRIETNDSFRLQFMAKREIDEIPDGAVTVSGTEVNSTFDAETQTLTLTPIDALTAGEEYTVTIDKTKLADIDFAYEGTTEFKVEAIAPRTTNLGTIVNTNFDDATVQNWTSGAANEGYSATLTPVTDGDDKVLQVVMPKSGDDTNGGNQAIAHFELPEGIKYEEGKVVVIKAKVKSVTNTPYMIQINRRDTLSQPANIRQLNCYALAGQMPEGATNQLVFGTNSLHTYANGNQWRALLPFNHDANKEKFSFSDVDLANKWVEWEIVLDGTTNKMNVKATVEGLDNTLTTWSTQNPVSALNPAQVLNYEFGKGTNITTFSGLDSISFVNNSTAAEGTLYVDYVTVENKKDTAKVTSALTVNGVAVDKFNIGDTVVPQFTVNPAISDKYTAISVMYVDGVIDTMYMEEIESENTCATTITSENSFTVPAKGDVVIKTFVWDKFETMKPLGNAATAELNDSIEVYVASNGDDINGTGDITSPVATLEKAIDMANDKVSAISGFDGRVEVIVDNGTYSPVTVSKSDIKVPAGGLVITSAEGAKPVISGGVDFDIAQATKVEDAAILNRISSQAAKDNLYVLDLTGIDVPAESWPGVKSFGVEALAEAADGITIPEDSYLISFNGQLMTNARWPNTGYEKALTVGGNKDSATSENVKDGFTLGCSNTNDWSSASDALIFGFFGNGWATQTTPLAGKSGNTITSAYASRYGASETHAKYYVYNLLEEIDTPYEYYIDRSVTPNKLYFYKPATVTEGNITFATQKNVLLTLSDVSNVTVDGLTFENTIGRAVSVSRGSNNIIKNCEIRNVFADIDSESDNAVLDVFSKNTVVDSNYIHNTNGGIKVGSDTPDTDTKTLASANNIIRNNHIENYGLSDKVYVDAIYCMGIGNQILNNEIHNSEHLAMRISGINHNIQYNEIYDVCKETEDVGAIYMGHTWTSRGNKIVNNYFHDINTTVDTSETGVNPIAAIFLDDHFAGAYIEGNIFANIGGDGIRSNRGREGYINNNLFVNCTRYGIALWSADTADDATTEGNYSGWLESVKNIQGKVADGTYDATVWTKAFPELINTKDEDWVKPEKFTVTNNIAVNGAKCLNVGDWITTLATKIDANEVTANDPGFKDMANGDYTIDLSLLQAIVPQFKDVQFVNMGRK